jgi:hypothetical protein
VAARNHPINVSDNAAAPVKVKLGWSDWVTMFAAVIAAWAFNAGNQLAIDGGIKPAYQAVCLAYSDFVLTQAHNGYTPEQFQHVVDFADNHKLMPDSDAPDRLSMPNRWPTISDEKACGTPAQNIDHAKP